MGVFNKVLERNKEKKVLENKVLNYTIFKNIVFIHF